MNLIMCKFIKIFTVFLILFLIFSCKVIKNIFYFIIYSCLFCILPEILSQLTILIMPWLSCKIIVNKANIFLITCKLTKCLTIPLRIYPINMIFTDNIKIILILCNNKCICMKQLNKLYEYILLSELIYIKYKNSGIKIMISVNIKNLFSIITEYISLGNNRVT